MWVRQAEAARVENVSRQWINQLVRDKRIQTDDQRRVNLIDVRRLRASELDPARGAHKDGTGHARPGPQPSANFGAGTATAGLSFQQARTAREAYQARMAQLDLQEREGLLVRKDDVERGARALAVAVVQQLDTIPDRISAEFSANAEDRARLRDRLRNEIDNVRAEFARAALIGAENA